MAGQGYDQRHGRDRSDRNRLARRDRRAADASGWPGRCATPTPTCRTTAQRSTPPAYIRTISARLADLAKFPFTTKHDLRANYPFGMFARAARAARAHPCLLRHHRQADRRGLHRARPRHLGRCRCALAAMPPAGGRGCALHNAYGYGLFTGGLGLHAGARTAGLHRRPGLRRHDRAPGAADRRFPPRRHHRHAELHAGDPRRFPPPGARSARIVLQVGIFGAEPWTNAMRREIEAGFAHGRGRYLRPVGSDGPRRRQRMRGNQGRPALSGKIISTPRSSIPTPAPCCRTARSANWYSPR